MPFSMHDQFAIVFSQLDGWMHLNLGVYALLLETT